MTVIAFLGAGHTKSKQYRDRIEAFGIPIAYTEQEVLSLLEPFLI